MVHGRGWMVRGVGSAIVVVVPAVSWRAVMGGAASGIVRRTTVSVDVGGTSPVNVSRASAKGISVNGAPPTMRGTATSTVGVPPGPGRFTWEQRDHKTNEANKDIFHDLPYLLVTWT
jgi:hypothetical protein